MQKLEDLQLEEHTVIVFSSDNGPWTVYGNHAGSTPFREAKGTSFDGGVKSALIIKYPGVVPAGQSSDDFLYSVDLMPTLCAITGSPLPENEIDGENALPVLENKPGFEYRRPCHAFSTGKNFEGIFSSDGRWKLHLPHKYRQVKTYGNDGKPGVYAIKEIPLSLFDMENDPMETTDVKEDHPEILKELMEVAARHEELYYK